jgi:hypothetical protein
MKCYLEDMYILRYDETAHSEFGVCIRLLRAIVFVTVLYWYSILLNLCEAKHQTSNDVRSLLLKGS